MGTQDQVDALNASWRAQGAMAIMRHTLENVPLGRVAVTSSFGVESAVLLHLVSKVDRSVPIFFLDTGKHFKETLYYRDKLVGLFGFRNLMILKPDIEDLESLDPEGLLHKSDTETCCEIRKVAPLDKAMEGYDAWITGRKRYQNSDREDIPIFENGRKNKIKINPLANWNQKDIKSYMEWNNIPAHELQAKGYASIGCEVCTTRVKPGEDSRAGRWRNSEKTECGIHITADGKIVRTNVS